MARIGVIIGSVREGARVSEPIAKWVAKSLEGKAEAEIVDLKDYPLSFMDEGGSPRYNPERKPKLATQKWLDKIAEFDGYVVVTPEYNRATSAVLKNAIDHVDYQMDNKPVALVGHGSSGGAQAIATLRITFPGIGVPTLPTAVFLQNTIVENISESGELATEVASEPFGPQVQLDGMVDSLLAYTEALKTLR